jgi:hypothetical protein
MCGFWIRWINVLELFWGAGNDKVNEGQCLVAWNKIMTAYYLWWIRCQKLSFEGALAELFYTLVKIQVGDAGQLNFGITDGLMAWLSLTLHSHC